ncbi:MAG TPA: tetratricopeptide repeat protein [Myxococcota bacterium]|nr:tetratricopeptide repeat protein [Myxococcota bacterium]HRY96085.1 tetratricopeptide repeat protein [Myxococcota bacterium]HSA21604.1 tetratricopeptide repeat protein [Myxococcota bacterium]
MGGGSRRLRDLLWVGLGLAAGALALGAAWLWEEEAHRWFDPEQRLRARALAAVRDGDSQAAIAAFRELRALPGPRDDAWDDGHELGLSLCRLGRVDEALAELAALPPGARDSAGRAFLWSRCLAEAGRLEQALALQRRGLDGSEGAARWRRLAALQAARPAGPLDFALASERVPVRLLRAADGELRCPGQALLAAGCGERGERLACLPATGVPWNDTDYPFGQNKKTWSCRGTGPVRAEAEPIPVFALCAPW